mgnify:CR=1 FL=1
MTVNRLIAQLSVICLLVAPENLLAADREHQQIMADIRMLQEQTTRLQILMASLGEALQDLPVAIDEKIERIDAKFETHADSARRAFIDQQVSIDSVADGVRILRERFDDTNVRISSLSQEIEALRVAIPPMSPSYTRLITDPETGLPFEAGPAPAIPIQSGPASPGVSPQRMYDTAWADYTTGQWMLSIQGFEAYIKAFPGSELADDAQFYIGQTHYADGSFEAAVDAFERVLLNYPDSDVVPEASYKRGLALDRLGDKPGAKEAFELVVMNYPDSTMAALASQALERLNQQ